MRAYTSLLDRDKYCLSLLYIPVHASTCNSLGATDAMNGYFLLSPKNYESRGLGWIKKMSLRSGFLYVYVAVRTLLYKVVK